MTTKTTKATTTPAEAPTPANVQFASHVDMQIPVYMTTRIRAFVQTAEGAQQRTRQSIEETPRVIITKTLPQHIVDALPAGMGLIISNPSPRGIRAIRLKMGAFEFPLLMHSPRRMETSQYGTQVERGGCWIMRTCRTTVDTDGVMVFQRKRGQDDDEHAPFMSPTNSGAIHQDPSFNVLFPGMEAAVIEALFAIAEEAVAALASCTTDTQQATNTMAPATDTPTAPVRDADEAFAVG